MQFLLNEGGSLMRNALVILTAFFVGSTLVACNSKSRPAAPQPDPAPKKDEQGRMGWTLTFQRKCAETVENTECLAVHGFSVSTNGDYQVGPGPQGELRKGTLAPEELQVISSALASTLSSATARPETHETIEATETQDSVTLVRGANSPEVLVRTAGTDLYFQTQNADEAKSLLSAVQNLATKYYKLPFPDACNDGAASLLAMFATVQTCTIDTDCTYLDSAFDPIAPNNSEELVTDDCSIVTPLVVGNLESVRSKKALLSESLDNVRAACGDNMIRSDCTNISTFALTGAAPVCQQGVCKLPAGQ
jgi:hypothetical protein